MRNTERHNETVSRIVDHHRERIEEQEPDWEPLEELLPADELPGFMWMGAHEGPGGRKIQSYKHGITRGYLHLTLEDGRPQAWTYKSLERTPTFRARETSDALEEHYRALEELEELPETAYDNEYRARRNAALKDAGWTVIQ